MKSSELLPSADLSEIIGAFAERRLERKLSDSFLDEDEASSTGYFNPTQGTLEVEKFYVYEMSDGSLRVEATFTGEIEVECEVEKVKRK